MSTRRRLANRYRADRDDQRTVTTIVHVCQTCRREFAAGTRTGVLQQHQAGHQAQARRRPPMSDPPAAGDRVDFNDLPWEGIPHPGLGGCSSGNRCGACRQAAKAAAEQVAAARSVPPAVGDLCTRVAAVLNGWPDGGGWLTTREADNLLDVLMPVITAAVTEATAAVPAWTCPNCGAETRARMADHPAAGDPT